MGQNAEGINKLIDLMQPLIALFIVALVGILVKNIWSWISKGRLSEIKDMLDTADKQCKDAHSRLHERIDKAVEDSDTKVRAAEDRLLKLETQREADSQAIRHFDERISRFEQKMDDIRRELLEKMDANSRQLNEFLLKTQNNREGK